MASYYNEIDPFAAAWLRELIKAGQIADGEVDERSIVDVRPEDIRGFSQCHFFAGIGGWSYALRLAGWPDDRPVWTGSCPCQPFSSAGQGVGGDDPRHLWPTWFRLIAECRPSVVFGEQVASAVNHGWFDLVCDDLEREGYAAGAASLPAPSVGAFHIRQRLWFVAHAERERGRSGESRREDAGDVGFASEVGNLVNAFSLGQPRGQFRDGSRAQSERGNAAERSRLLLQVAKRRAVDWTAAEWIDCADGKARPVESAYVWLADGVSGPVVLGRDCSGAVKSAWPTPNAGPQNDTDSRWQERRAVLKQQHRNGNGFGLTLGMAASLYGETQIDRDGRSEVRAVRQDKLQASCPPQGPEPDEQQPVELADFVRLLPSSLALAQLHGDRATEEALLALLAASGAERLVQHPPLQVEAAWRSLSQEAQNRFRLGVEQGRFVRTVVFPLAHGIPARVGRLRGYGNAIVPQLAAAFIESYLACAESRGDA